MRERAVVGEKNMYNKHKPLQDAFAFSLRCGYNSPALKRRWDSANELEKRSIVSKRVMQSVQTGVKHEQQGRERGKER